MLVKFGVTSTQTQGEDRFLVIFAEILTMFSRVAWSNKFRNIAAKQKCRLAVKIYCV